MRDVTLNGWADCLQHLQLHRIPFLTVDVLALFVPSMRNLKTLSVLKCQLIHVGHTLRLLEIIKTDRVKERENQVNLDFYPQFHHGPGGGISRYAGPYAVGAYGVTWDNWYHDSRLGVWALASQIFKQARSQNVDLESKGTSFRKWLDDGPCWEVDLTINALLDPKYENARARRAEILAKAEDLRSAEEVSELHDAEHCIAALVARIDTANPDHLGNARKFSGVVPNRPTGWKW